MKPKNIFFIGILLCFLITAPVRGNELEARRERMRQDMAATYNEVAEALEGILDKVNLNQRPDATEIERAVEVLEENRRNAVAYDSPQKAGYMLLQSWAAYYQDDPATTLNWAVRAWREDDDNGDAWISQTLFSLIYGRRPMEPRAARSPRRGQPPVEILQTHGSHGPAYGRPGTLTFDLASLIRPALRERFVRQTWRTVDGSSIVYRPDEQILCVLFWAGEGNALPAPSDPATGRDPNAPAGAAQHTPEHIGPGMMPDMMPGMPGMPGMPMSHDTGSGEASLEAQQGYFEVMQEALAGKTDVKFVEMNTNTPDTAAAAMTGYHPVAPLVVAAMPNSGAGGYVGLDFPMPFMAIVDKGGQVKYAGPADGFMPAFILSHLTGVPIDLAPYEAEPPVPAPAYAPPMPQAPTAPGMPDMPGMPGMPGPPAQSPQAPSQYRELTPEQQVDAERKITYARDVFMRAARLRVQTFKRGVEICRDIMQTYPQTKYADEARQLLRQVPENRRSQYNITDEELGL